MLCSVSGDFVSDGASYKMSNHALQGVLIRLSSVVIAGGLFVMGVVNSSRKKSQAQKFAQAAVTTSLTGFMSSSEDPDRQVTGVFTS